MIRTTLKLFTCILGLLLSVNLLATEKTRIKTHASYELFSSIAQGQYLHWTITETAPNVFQADYNLPITLCLNETYTFSFKTTQTPEHITVDPDGATTSAVPTGPNGLNGLDFWSGDFNSAGITYMFYQFGWNTPGLKMIQIDLLHRYTGAVETSLRIPILVTDGQMPFKLETSDDACQLGSFNFNLTTLNGLPASMSEWAAISSVTYTVEKPDGNFTNVPHNNTPPYNASFQATQFGTYIVRAVLKRRCGGKDIYLRETVTFGDQSYSYNYTIYNNENWSQSGHPLFNTNPIKITNRILVKSGATLTIGSGKTVELGPNGIIEIENGGSLIANGVTFGAYSSCPNVVWSGFSVMGNLELNGGEVKDCNGYAISANDGGEVKANGTAFNSNLNGISFNNASDRYYATASEISSCSFQYTSSTMNGVYVRNYDGILIRENNFIAANGGYNGVGIQVVDAGINTDGNTFQNLNAGIKGTHHTNSAQVMTLENDFFTDCFDGIELAGTGSKIIVNRSTFRLAANPTGYMDAIKFDGINDVDVTNCDIQDYFRGVYFKNTCGYGSQNCNIRGNKFDDTNRSIQLQENSSRVYIACNDFNATDGATIAHIYVYNGSVATQGTSSFPHKNLFRGTTTISDILSNVYMTYYMYAPTSGTVNQDYIPTKNWRVTLNGVNLPYPADGYCPNPIRVQSASNDVEIFETTNSIETATSLNNFPNPFNDVTTIEYEIAQDNGVMTVLDITGKVVRTISLSANQGQVTFEKQNLQSGIYMIQLTSNGEVVANSKMMIK